MPPRVIILATLALAFVMEGYAQSLNLRGRVQVDLVIDPAGSATASMASSKLMWNKLDRPSKIMVSTVSPGQRFDLSVAAEDVKRADPVGSVVLIDGMPATEFIVNAGSKHSGQCTLRYTAAATPAQGIGQDVHLVTYTLTEQ